MSDSSSHSIHQIAEGSYGVTPINPNFKTIRHTGTNLGLTKSTFVSEELRPDRQITNFRHGTKQTGGEIMGELSFATFDDFFQAALLGTWAVKAAPYSAATISAAAADNSINDSASALPVLTAGDKVTIAGFTGAGTTANGNFTVVSSTAAKMVLAGGTPLVNDAAGEVVTLTTLTQVLKVGTQRRSFSLLRKFEDQPAKPFHLLIGQEVSKLTLTTTVNAAIKVGIGFVGKDVAVPAATAPGGSTFVAVNTNAVMDSFSGSIIEGGAVIATVTEIALTLENGIAPRFVLGSDTTRLPSIGRSNLTGTVMSFFEDSSLYEKFLGETESSLVFTLADKSGNAYRFTLPRIKYNGGQPDTQGQGPITTQCPVQALLDSTTGSNLIIEKN